MTRGMATSELHLIMLALAPPMPAVLHEAIWTRKEGSRGNGE